MQETVRCIKINSKVHAHLLPLDEAINNSNISLPYTSSTTFTLPCQNKVPSLTSGASSSYLTLRSPAEADTGTRIPVSTHFTFQITGKVSICLLKQQEKKNRNPCGIQHQSSTSSLLAFIGIMALTMVGFYGQFLISMWIEGRKTDLLLTDLAPKQISLFPDDLQMIGNRLWRPRRHSFH